MSPDEAHWHEYNPWKDRIVYVPIEELAEALAGGDIGLRDGSIVPLDAAFLLDHWNQHGELLDAYILPSGEPFRNSPGIRYGCDGPDYVSPGNTNREALQELLDKHQNNQALGMSVR